MMGAIQGKDIKRGPGRPRKAAPWEPGALLDVADKDPNNRYRWCRDEPDNIRKKLSERWFAANKISGVGAEHAGGHSVIDGKPLDTSVGVRELTLMAMDEADGKARDEYYRARTERQTISKPEQTIAAHAEKAPGAPFRGGEIVTT